MQKHWLCIYGSKLNLLGKEGEHSKAVVDTCLGDGCPETGYRLCKLQAGASALVLLLMLYPFFVLVEEEGKVHLCRRGRKEEVEQDPIYKSSVDSGVARAH